MDWPAHPVILGRMAAFACMLVVSTSANTTASIEHGEPRADAQALGDCRRLPLVDAATGKLLRGIEDIEVDPEAGVAYLSAQDRWALENAVDSGAASLPQGGIYLLRPEQLRQADRPAALRNLTAGFTGQADFHPHGIAFYRAGTGPALLAAINRAYRAGKAAGADAWRPETSIEIFAVTPEGLQHRSSLAASAFCHPNNLAWIDESRLLVTNDHAACGALGVWVETLLGGDGTVVLASLTPDFSLAETTVVADSVPYANGIAVDRKDDRVLVAATRASAVFSFALADLAEGTTAPAVERIELDGGPDNLTWQADAPLLMAVHPDLFSLGLYRNQWLGAEHAPSRVVAVCADDRRTRTLFDDRGGMLFSAATVAVSLDEYLLIGSVAEPGLFACHPAPSASCGKEIP